MATSLTPPTSLYPVPGVRISTAAAGIKYHNRDDLVLIEFCDDSHVAAVFTKNQYCAAPVILAKQHLNIMHPKYFLINSGNANAGLGKNGLIDANYICNFIAENSGCLIEQVIPFSTGVIGEPLPVKKIIQKIPRLLNGLKDDVWLAAAKAIMTTDTICKGVSDKLVLDGREITITGIAKGSGMIRPDMATMLSFVATDLEINTEELNKLLKDAVNQSYHCITVDGDTSTNDASVLIATGKGGISFDRLSAFEKSKFKEKVVKIFIALAQAIIRDGEGATKFLTIIVEKAENFSMAREISFSVAQSPLVKTAAFASDPNWGRILAAVGKVHDQKIDLNKVSLFLNSLKVIDKGELSSSYSERLGKKEMRKSDIQIIISLGLGDCYSKVWTTDLSHEYIKINAEYRT